MKNTTIKRVTALVLALVLCFSTLPTIAPTASADTYSGLSESKYAKVFTLATSGRVTVYTASDLKTPGNNRGACNAWIDAAADELWLFGVGVTNGQFWAKISYPITGSSDRRIGFIPLSALSTNEYSVTSVASVKYHCAPRLGSSAKSSYYIDAGDRITLLGVHGDWVQLLYPAGNRYRIAFALKSDYLRGGGTIPSTSSLKSETPSNGSYVRIRHAGSGRYLDVPAEGISSSGTQLQIWDYAYSHQNQVFRMIDTGKGWKILSHQSGKCIEVRNSSHDDYAQVAQWDKHDLACARWDIVNNSDGSVSFRNRESGKYLNVCGGGNAPNGTKMIQYHDDGSSAMRFYIEVMGDSDVLSATYVRFINNSDLRWTRYNPFTSNIINSTKWNKQDGSKYYYPTVGQNVFVSAEYLSPNTVANLLRDKSYSKSTWNQIEDALTGEMTESAISTLLAKLGFSEVPGLGTALGILQALSDSRDAEQWNRFVDAAKIDVQGRCSGVVINTYYTVVENPVWTLIPNKIAYGWQYFIKKTTTVEYKTWTGDNFGSVKKLPVSNTNGTWSYSFK